MPIFYNFFSQDSQVAIHSDDAFAPVAFLKLKTITLRDKKVSGDFDTVFRDGLGSILGDQTITLYYRSTSLPLASSRWV